jgi:hypothetical protein
MPARACRGDSATRSPRRSSPGSGITDLTGSGQTIVHASTGVFHNARLGGGNLGNLSGNPPFIHNPIVFYSTISTLLGPGSTSLINPPTVEAITPDYKTPLAYNWSAGVRRDIGWGTAVDAIRRERRAQHGDV